MILDRAKAWVALIGAILTALIASDVIPTEGRWHDGLTVASVVVTTVTTYLTPNKDVEVSHDVE